MTGPALVCRFAFVSGGFLCGDGMSALISVNHVERRVKAPRVLEWWSALRACHRKVASRRTLNAI